MVATFSDPCCCPVNALIDLIKCPCYVYALLGATVYVLLWSHQPAPFHCAEAPVENSDQVKNGGLYRWLDSIDTTHKCPFYYGNGSSTFTYIDGGGKSSQAMVGDIVDHYDTLGTIADMTISFPGVDKRRPLDGCAWDGMVVSLSDCEHFARAMKLNFTMNHSAPVGCSMFYRENPKQGMLNGPFVADQHTSLMLGPDRSNGLIQFGKHMDVNAGDTFSPYYYDFGIVERGICVSCHLLRTATECQLDSCVWDSDSWSCIHVTGMPPSNLSKYNCQPNTRTGGVPASAMCPFVTRASCAFDKRVLEVSDCESWAGARGLEFDNSSTTSFGGCYENADGTIQFGEAHLHTLQAETEICLECSMSAEGYCPQSCKWNAISLRCAPLLLVAAHSGCAGASDFASSEACENAATAMNRPFDSTESQQRGCSVNEAGAAQYSSNINWHSQPMPALCFDCATLDTARTCRNLGCKWNSTSSACSSSHCPSARNSLDAFDSSVGCPWFMPGPSTRCPRGSSIINATDCQVAASVLGLTFSSGTGSIAGCAIHHEAGERTLRFTDDDLTSDLTSDSGHVVCVDCSNALESDVPSSCGDPTTRGSLCMSCDASEPSLCDGFSSSVGFSFAYCPGNCTSDTCAAPVQLSHGDCPGVLATRAACEFAADAMGQPFSTSIGPRQGCSIDEFGVVRYSAALHFGQSSSAQPNLCVSCALGNGAPSSCSSLGCRWDSASSLCVSRDAWFMSDYRETCQSGNALTDAQDCQAAAGALGFRFENSSGSVAGCSVFAASEGTLRFSDVPNVTEPRRYADRSLCVDCSALPSTCPASCESNLHGCGLNMSGAPPYRVAHGQVHPNEHHYGSQSAGFPFYVTLQESCQDRHSVASADECRRAAQTLGFSFDSTLSLTRLGCSQKDESSFQFGQDSASEVANSMCVDCMLARTAVSCRLLVGSCSWDEGAGKCQGRGMCVCPSDLGLPAPPICDEDGEVRCLPLGVQLECIPYMVMALGVIIIWHQVPKFSSYFHKKSHPSEESLLPLTDSPGNDSMGKVELAAQGVVKFGMAKNAGDGLATIVELIVVVQAAWWWPMEYYGPPAYFLVLFFLSLPSLYYMMTSRNVVKAVDGKKICEMDPCPMMDFLLPSFVTPVPWWFRAQRLLRPLAALCIVVLGSHKAAPPGALSSWGLSLSCALDWTPGFDRLGFAGGCDSLLTWISSVQPFNPSRFAEAGKAQAVLLRNIDLDRGKWVGQEELPAGMLNFAMTQEILWFHMLCLAALLPHMVMVMLSSVQVDDSKAAEIFEAAEKLGATSLWVGRFEADSPLCNKTLGWTDQLQDAITFRNPIRKVVKYKDYEITPIQPGLWQTCMLMKALLGKVVHVATDLLTVHNYYNWHHYQFGTVILTMYCIHVHDHFATYATICQEFVKSAKRGFFTDNLIRLQDSQATMQGIPTLAVIAYALPYAVHDRFSLCQQVFNLLLAVKAVAEFKTKRAAGARLKKF